MFGASSPFLTPPGTIAAPVLLQIEISSKCNLKCRMCPLTLETTMSSSDQDGLMADATWEQVIEIGKQAGTIIIAGFGEPMTNPEFRRMLRDLDEARINFSFSTNGIGFEKFAPELATLKYLRHVNISIDSPDPEVYHDIRGGDVKRALSGAKAIAAALKGRVAVTVAAVVMKSNAQSLLGFPKILSEMGIGCLVLSSLHAYTEELAVEYMHKAGPLHVLNNKPWVFTKENVLAALAKECEKHSVQLMRGERVDLDSYQPVEAAAKYFDEEGSGLTRACGVPFEHMYLDAAGRVFPCCHAASGPLLGQLGPDKTLLDIWRDEPAESFRKAILDAATTPDVCRSCTVAPLGEHPNKLWAGEVVAADYLTTGGVRLHVRNTGTGVWTREFPLSLGSARPYDRPSARQTQLWRAPHRLGVMHDDVVPPGMVTTLLFELGPAEDGREEFFQLLVEGKAWLYSTTHSYRPEPSYFGPIPVHLEQPVMADQSV